MMIRNPQPSAQELVDAQMHGMKTFSLKWVSILVLLVFEIIFISSSYHARLVTVSKENDYRIIDCQVEDLGDKYRLHVTVESLSGQEQNVTIYSDNEWFWGEFFDEDAYLLPAYETAVVTYTIHKEHAGDSLTLKLDAFEEQTWEVELP